MTEDPTTSVSVDCPRFRLLASGKVQQQDAAGLTEFDPGTWAEYAAENGRPVHAVRIPKPFLLAGDHCADGWLVRDDRGLKAISNETFCREYQLSLTLEPPAVEAA